MMNPLSFGRMEVNLHPIQEQRFSQIRQCPTMHGKNPTKEKIFEFCAEPLIAACFVCLFVFARNLWLCVWGFFCLFSNKIKKKDKYQNSTSFSCVFSRDVVFARDGTGIRF